MSRNSAIKGMTKRELDYLVNEGKRLFKEIQKEARERRRNICQKRGFLLILHLKSVPIPIEESKWKQRSFI